MNKGILMDIGDTIIHNNNIDFKKSLSSLYDYLSISFSKENFIEYSYNLLKNIFNERSIIEFKMIDFLFQLKNYFNFETEYSIEELEELFAKNCCTNSKVNDIEKFLLYIKNKGYKLIALSNTSFSRNVIYKMLDDLLVYFDDVIISSECVFRKPHKSIFEIGISKIDLPKQNIYYIGNNFFCDIYGSYNAGINSIWFNENGIQKDFDEGLNIKYFQISSYNELINNDF